MRLYSGCSGFSYQEWKGTFYPSDLAAKQFLGFYAKKMPSVELNNTFYRTPKPEQLASWASEVPDHFRFALKASRRITHFGRLGDVAAVTESLIQTVSALGPKLGIVLFQLPPNLKQDTDRLRKFLQLVEGRVPVAVEFRHGSWYTEETLGILKAHDAALVIGDPEDGVPEAPWRCTGTRSYVRLRKDSYSEGELEGWATKLKQLSASEAFVFFKHEVTAPAYAQAFSRFFEASS
ncbi:MAG: hypothetical protein RJA70_640 [Pseudomonadota bacterium]|jgi:uncharacterized protein YecE (DUF72 family)